MLDEIRTLKKPKSKRVFALITLLFLLAETLLLYLVDWKLQTVTNLALIITKEVLINLIATTVTAGLLVIIISYFLPKEHQDSKVEVLDYDETNRKHYETLTDSTFWSHNGHLGRWVRVNVFPYLSSASVKKGIPTHSDLIILNPKNVKVCGQYYRFRRGMAFQDNDINSIEDVQAELLATLLSSQFYNQDFSELHVNVYFKDYLNVVREDINSNAVFRTQIDPRCSSIVFNNTSSKHNSEFYNTARKNFEITLKSCDHVDLSSNVLQYKRTDITIEIIRNYLLSIDLLVVDSHNFLNNVYNRFYSDYDPYK